MVSCTAHTSYHPPLLPVLWVPVVAQIRTGVFLFFFLVVVFEVVFVPHPSSYNEKKVWRDVPIALEGEKIAAFMR